MTRGSSLYRHIQCFALRRDHLINVFCSSLAMPPKPRHDTGKNPKCSIEVNKGTVVQMKKPKVLTSSFKRERNVHSAEPSENPGTLTPTQAACRQWFTTNVGDKGTRGIRKDFVTEVRSYVPKGGTDAFLEEMNAGKNRYEDILLLDASRVRLADNFGEDYIHASWVQVSPEQKYICTQGPLPETIIDFWHMIVQENVKLIIQLCQNVEEGDQKSEAYFKTGQGEQTEWGRYTVKTVEKPKKMAGYDQMRRTKLQVSRPNQTHTVTHILYMGWPDHFVPDSAIGCRQLHEHAKKFGDKKPIVVHCSAGVGRTGTFVAMEMLLHKLLVEKDSSVTAVETVTKLRDQRMHAVQNDQQYVFLHRIVIDVILKEEPDALPKQQVDKFLEDYNSLIERKKAEMKKQQSQK
ncbi:protein-tyrosine phosphatase [Aphelenchoides avenae]|nr:protein-tyrosine phosphatase [Aphelenchus avenae]